MSLASGTRLGPYEILAPIGAGGMGEVYKARDTRLGRTVAIKMLHGAQTDRLKREARAIAALNHPHICTLHDIGPDYLVMEYVEGTPLRGPMSPGEARRLALQIVGALEAAHAKGIIHRDLKPANILLTPMGAKILDFGLAKWQPDADAAETASDQTVAGAILGTAAYMSPEQAGGKPADARSDIFSFGLVLYEMLSGGRAFAGDTPVSIMAAIVHQEPMHLDAPPHLARIVSRCLEKSPAARFQSMAELKAALESTKLAIQLAATPTGPSIAVLPFANLSGDPENEYFSDGLAEEILNALTKLPGLKVVARTSAFAFKGRNEDIRVIGEKLNVTHILEGSVRKSGTRVRVTGQLINVADGWHIWSDRCDHELTDVFAIQDQISQAIVSALKLKLVAPAHVPAGRRSIHPEAYECYLKGRFFWNQRSESGLKQAIDRFRRAIELDPTYPMAYVGLSDSYSLLSIFGVHPPGEIAPKARAAALKAVELDESLAEAHATLGHVLNAHDWNFVEAEREFKRAIELNPNYSIAHQRYGHMLAMLGRFDEAIAEAAIARELDPLSVPIAAIRAIILQRARQIDRAVAAARQAVELDPDHHFARWMLARTLDAHGDLAEALAEAETGVRLSGGWQTLVAQQSYAHARIGDLGKARAGLEQLFAQSREKYVSPLDIALVYLGLRENDKVFEWLEKAYQERTVRLLELPDPVFDSLRPDPRYGNLMRRLGLEQQI